MNKKTSKISIVIPVFNEASTIAKLYKEMKNVLEQIGKDYELIFVDDCSQDETPEILTDFYAQDKRVQVVCLLGNQGQTMALSAGFKQATGDVVLAMDGDGQHDPRYIPEFISAIEEGYDIVSSWKTKDETSSRLKFALSNIAHRLIGKISGAKMKYFGATMKAYRRDILRHLELSGDLHRFAGALVHYRGIKIKEIPIEIRPRQGGKSSYSLSKILKVALDLILIKFLTGYSKTPFRIFGFFGLLFIGLGAVGVSLIYGAKYFFGVSALSNVAGLVISSLFFTVGIQMLFFGLIAEMVSRIYYTSNNKEFFSVRSHYKHNDSD